ncbi:MAG: toxin-antitoxin system YwqK family antitoxin [Lentimicrobium sp.]
MKRIPANKAFILLVLSGLLIPVICSASWPFKHEVNRYDSLGRRQGKWITWWDEEKKIPMNIERYKDGRERGKCRYYYQDGTKRLQFMAFKDGRMKVKYYLESGKLEKKGWAVMIYDPQEIRYSWNGTWKFYEDGKLVKKSVYKMGEEVENQISGSD